MLFMHPTQNVNTILSRGAIATISLLFLPLFFFIWQTTITKQTNSQSRSPFPFIHSLNEQAIPRAWIHRFSKSLVCLRQQCCCCCCCSSHRRWVMWGICLVCVCVDYLSNCFVMWAYIFAHQTIPPSLNRALCSMQLLLFVGAPPWGVRREFFDVFVCVWCYLRMCVCVCI